MKEIKKIAANTTFTKTEDFGILLEIIQKNKPLTRLEQNELIIKIQSESDQFIQKRLAEKLFNHNLRFVVKIAKQQTSYHPSLFKEALSLGVEGLWECIYKKVFTGEYLPHESSFLSFSVKYIQGYILSGFSQLVAHGIHVPSHAYYPYVRMHRYRDELFTRHEFDVFDIHDIPDDLLNCRISNSFAKEIHRFYTQKIVSTSECVYKKRCLDSEDEFEITPDSMMSSDYLNPEHVFKESDMRIALQRIFKFFKTRAYFIEAINGHRVRNEFRNIEIFETWVLKIYEGSEINFEEFGFLYGISSERVRQIINRKLLVIRTVSQALELREYF